jgi:DNA-binding NarL/FixJ family response regulator
MIMSNQSFERTKLVDDKNQQQQTKDSQIKILIVDGNLSVRQGLSQLIDREYHLGLCAEADNASQALAAIEKYQLDFAIVDISPGSETSAQLAEGIKLQCPNLPVLILSINDEVFYYKDALSGMIPKSDIDQQAAEKIIEAIRYIQSLLKSHVFGFAVLVKVERSG